jgi:hypothetical protein
MAVVAGIRETVLCRCRLRAKTQAVYETKLAGLPRVFGALAPDVLAGEEVGDPHARSGSASGYGSVPPAASRGDVSLQDGAPQQRGAPPAGAPL